MRNPSSVFAVGRYALALAVITGSVVLMSAPKKTAFTPHDKAYYASEATVNFVRPGLTLKVVSATIAQDGTISVDYKVADPDGLPLDPAGITTPGAVSVSFLCAYIPKGQTQFYDYNSRASAAATGTASATIPPPIPLPGFRLAGRPPTPATSSAPQAATSATIRCPSTAARASVSISASCATSRRPPIPTPATPWTGK